MAARDGRGEDVRVAVLESGIMGSAMARNLVSAGLRTTGLGSVARSNGAAVRGRSAGGSVRPRRRPGMRTW